MHETALKIGQLFFDIYASQDWTRVVEIGSMDVNGSLRGFAPPGAQYIGLDAEPGRSVDLVMSIGDPLPLESGSADCVLSSSQMEHDDFFWMTFLEMARVTRPGGFIYVNAPSNGHYTTSTSSPENWLGLWIGSCR